MKNKTIRLIIVIAIIIIVMDQLSKFLLTNYLKESIGNSIFKLEIVENTGMAFGFNEGNTKNIFLMIVVLAMMISFIKKQIERIDKKTAISLAMAIGGGISNLIDRIFRGYVLDFIKIYKFPVFNIADTFVIIGWILLIIFLIDFSKK